MEPYFVDLLTSKEKLNPKELSSALDYVIYDGITTQIMVSATEGIYLISFALILGASNFYIGLIAAVPFLSQIAQFLGIILIRKAQNRKLIVLSASALSRLILIIIAIAPFIVSFKVALNILVGGLLVRNLLGAIGGVSWNSWMKDLIPENTMGQFFAKRMGKAAMVGIPLLITFSLFLDYWTTQFPNQEIVGYSILFLAGMAAGLIGLYFLYKTPEITINPQMTSISLQDLFARPFKDRKFTNLLLFLFVWNFSVNLAAPFFTVYMLEQLGLSIFYVTGFMIISMVMSMMFLRIWGSVIDRFSNKTALLLAGPLFASTFVLWTFTTLGGTYFLTIPLIFLIHIINGVTISGIVLATGNIALKLSPKDQSTPYLATVGITNSIASGLAVIFGGLMVDYFVDKTLTISISYTTSTSSFSIPTFDLEQWEFVFIFAFILSLFALERLSIVHEEGRIDRRDAIVDILNQMRNNARRFTTIFGSTKTAQFTLDDHYNSNAVEEVNEENPIS